MTFCALSSAKGMDIKMKLLAKVSAFEECENIKTILLSQKITYRIEVRNKNNMFKFVTLLFITCIFRKNRALAPHERSAVPLGTDHCPVG